MPISLLVPTSNFMPQKQGIGIRLNSWYSLIPCAFLSLRRFETDSVFINAKRK